MENNSMFFQTIFPKYFECRSIRTENILDLSVYFYNFGWCDYGVANLATVLDIVKVMAFAVQEGKVAVHCHAGLGRTGNGY